MPFAWTTASFSVSNGVSPVALGKLKDMGIVNTPDSLYRDLRVRGILEPQIGAMLADSLLPPAARENLSDRPEVRDALALGSCVLMRIEGLGTSPVGQKVQAAWAALDGKERSKLLRKLAQKRQRFCSDVKAAISSRSAVVRGEGPRMTASANWTNGSVRSGL